jgi:hypothetical protein
VADIEVTRLVADVEVDAGDADADLEKTAALEDEVARDRHGKITMDLPDPARLAASSAALSTMRGHISSLITMSGGRTFFGTGSGGGAGTSIIPIPGGGGGGRGGGGGTIIIPAAAGGGDGGGGGGGATTGLIAGLLTKAGAQKIMGSKGALAALLGVGAAAGVGGIGAGFGTLGSFLGFGAEHFIGSAVGTAGSIAGGVLGGGLLGLGAAGVTAVGMGTDLAGIGQASGDIKKTYQALTQVQTAQQQYGNQAAALANVAKAQTAYNQTIQTYGVNSIQAFQAQTALTQAQSQYQSGVQATAAAQQNLNTVLSQFSPVARGAVLQAAQAAQHFRTVFDQVTGQAEKIGAQIITQVIGVATSFLPIVGRYAAQNMAIIQNALQPFFAWLQGPGMKIFIDLENIFQRNLPYAMGAFVNGMELFIKTIDQAAQYSGRFMKRLDDFFTRMNTQDYGKWHKGVQTLINLFFDWAGVVVAVFKVIVDVFKPAVGFGAAFAKELTRGLTALDNWLRSTKVFTALHELMQAHKVEFLDGLANVIKALAPLLGGILLAFIGIQTVGAQIGNSLLNGLAGFINWLNKNKAREHFLQMAGAVLVFAGAFGGALKIVAFALAKITGLFGPLITGIKALFGVFLAGELSTGWAVVILLALVAIGVGVYELYKHWKQVWTDIKNWYHDAVNFIRRNADWFAIFFPLITVIALLSDHWGHVWHDILAAFEIVKKHIADAINDIRHHLGLISLALLLLVPGLGIFLAIALNVATHWKAIWNGMYPIVIMALHLIRDALNLTWGFIKVWADEIAAVIKIAWSIITNVIRIAWDIIVGIFKVAIDILTGNWSAAWNAFVDIFVQFYNAIKNILGDVWDAVWGLIKQIWNFFAGAGRWLIDAGKQIIEGLIHGIKEGAKAIYDVIKGIAHDVLGFFGSLFGLGSPSFITHGYGVDLMQGMTEGIREGAKGSVSAATTAAGNVIASLKTGTVDQATANNINNLSNIYKNLSGMFTSITQAAKTAPNVAADVSTVATALNGVAGQAATLQNSVNMINNAMGKIKNTDGLDKLVTVLGDIGKIFINLNRLSKVSNKDPKGQMAGIDTLLNDMVQADVFGQLVKDVQKITDSLTFKGKGGKVQFAIDNKPLEGIAQTIKDLGGFMDKLNASAKSFAHDPVTQLKGIVGLLAGIVTSGALGWLQFFTQAIIDEVTDPTGKKKRGPRKLAVDPSKLNDFVKTVKALGGFLDQVNKTAASFAHDPVTQLKGMSDLLGQMVSSGYLKNIQDSVGKLEANRPSDKVIHDLVYDFDQLSKLMDAVNKTSGKAGNVSSAGLGNISTNVGKILTTIQVIAPGVNAATPAIVGAFTGMGTQINTYFTGTLIPAMNNYGNQMMTQLATGIIQGSKSVGNAMTFVGAAGATQFGTAMTAGLTNNYYIEAVHVGANNPSQFGLQMQQQSRLANATGGSKRAGS